LVEQWTENPCVGGSSPPHTTRERDAKVSLFYFQENPRVGDSLPAFVDGCCCFRICAAPLVLVPKHFFTGYQPVASLRLFDSFCWSKSVEQWIENL
jgi:hypothetical protein